ncbi:MAG: polyphosphate polymerase domain-containing protein [Bacteroidia bacterium]
MNGISDILNSFEPITLKEMDSVKLMNRTDRKFCFNTDRLSEILNLITSHYRILEIQQKRLSRYQTLYYDTANYDLYKLHQNGKLNRYKIRHRTYIESDLGFLEVKFKNNKGRTIKSRVNNREVPSEWKATHTEFINLKTPYNPEVLIPAIWINYNRLTLVNKTSAERLTIDLNLEFIKNETTLGFDKLVIAEVKQDKKNNSPFFNVMKQMHIREGSISKYAMGIALTCDVKKNNFKPKLKTISKIAHDNHHTFTSH